MKSWNWTVLIVCTSLMIWVFPVMAAPNTEKESYQFTYYKVGVLLKLNASANDKEFDQNAQDFHMHEKIPNSFNVLGIEKAKYSKQYDLWFWKLTGCLEVSQEELP